MAYNRKIWENGDVITEGGLNNMEEGIQEAHDKVKAIEQSDYATRDYVTQAIVEAQLPEGDINLSGYATKAYVDNEISTIELTPGPEGPQGPAGEKGEKGADGLTTAIKVNGTTYAHTDGLIILPDYTTKTSELINDSGFLTSVPSEYAKKSEIPIMTNDLTNSLKNNYDEAYTHAKSTHAPSNAQKNSDITKSEIEAKLTGTITTHSHNYATQDYVNSKIPSITITKMTQSQYNSLSSKDANTLYVIVG